MLQPLVENAICHFGISGRFRQAQAGAEIAAKRHNGRVWPLAFATMAPFWHWARACDSASDSPNVQSRLK